MLYNVAVFFALILVFNYEIKLIAYKQLLYIYFDKMCTLSEKTKNHTL